MADRWEDPGVIHVHHSNNNQIIYYLITKQTRVSFISVIIITCLYLFRRVRLRLSFGLADSG
jgi:hypothetical protein